MSIYLYAPVIYPGTLELMQALNAKRILKHDGMYFLHKGVPMEFNAADRIVCWGHHVPPVPNVPTFNANYVYTNQLSINKKLHRIVENTGITGIQLKEMSEDLYLKQMDLRSVGKLRLTKGEQCAAPDFYGYSSTHYPNTQGRKINWFVGMAANTPDARYASIIADYLKLQFISVYLFNVSNMPCVWKIRTAPKLTAGEVPDFAKTLLKHLSEL